MGAGANFFCKHNILLVNVQHIWSQFDCLTNLHYIALKFYPLKTFNCRNHFLNFSNKMCQWLCQSGALVKFFHLFEKIHKLNVVWVTALWIKWNKGHWKHDMVWRITKDALASMPANSCSKVGGNCDGCPLLTVGMAAEPRTNAAVPSRTTQCVSNIWFLINNCSVSCYQSLSFIWIEYTLPRLMMRHDPNFTFIPSSLGTSHLFLIQLLITYWTLKAAQQTPRAYFK